MTAPVGTELEEAKRLLHKHRIEKLLVVDRKIALVGSANISKRALVSNYEIMLKVSGKAAADISLMLDNLRKMLEDGRDV